jgi:signal transduction histidine kinase/CheY-like chemotaxis protein
MIMTYTSYDISDSFVREKAQQKAKDLLFAEALRPNLLVVLGSILFSALLYSPDNKVVIFSWQGFMIALAVFRSFIFLARQKRVEKHINARLYERIYFVITVIIGCSWGIPSFFPGVLLEKFTFFVIIIFMLFVTYVGSLVLVINFSLLLLYITGFPFLLVFALAYSSVLHASDILIMVGIAFAWFCMALMGYQQHRRIINEFSLQIKNKELIQRLENSNLAAKQASQAKSNFLANMSHEIRTPINGILGMTRLVINTNLEKEQRKLLDNVLYSAESLLGIINDILDFSKIEAGELSIELRDFSLERVLDNIISSLSFQAYDKKIFLKNTTDFNVVPKYIKADELRLRQTLINLIGNAIKFTNEGGVTVRVDVVNRFKDKITMHFSVTDTGIGISADKQERIFDYFSQADDSTARKFGGTGLGLAISKELIEMMGGTISIDSKEGQGSIFHFTVDVLQGKKAPQPSSVTENQYSSYNNLHILLVEDNKINQELARIILENDGQQVALANNGLECLQMLTTGSFDLILMDMQMPEMDGLTATAIIRNCENKYTGNAEIKPALEDQLIKKLLGKHIPIIAMTANVLEKDRQKCLDVGMDYYLSKPFLSDDLYGVLNKCLAASQQHGNDTEIKKT